jgi:phage shock protein PspC (stress-responsive transcriptional regulator)
MDRLTRSQHDRVLGGVCGGLARAWQIDVTLVRLAFILLALAGGTGLLLYFLLLILMPPEGSEAGAGEAASLSDGERQHRTTLVVGGALILLGAWLLLGHIPGLQWITLRNLGPLLLIGFGIWMIANQTRQRGD